MEVQPSGVMASSTRSSGSSAKDRTTPSSAASSPNGVAPATSSPKKNIILIITDQQRSIQWFPEDWEEENLPAMTLLKKHGISFAQAVNNTCACTPSRTTIFTGTYPSRNHSNFTLTEFVQPAPGPGASTATPFNIPPDNRPPTPYPGPFPLPLSASETQLDQTLPNLATILAEAGYDTYYKGKFHLSKGVLGYDNIYYDPDVTRYGFQQWDPPDAGQDAQIQNYGGGNADNDGRFTSDAVAFLQDRVTNEAQYTRPFCLVFSLVNPHDVLGYPANWNGPVDNGGYDQDDLVGDINLPLTVNEYLKINYKPTSQQDWLDLMNLQGPLHNQDQQINYLNFYGNLMIHVDQQILALLNVLLEQKGQSVWRNTMIIRTSDHGEMGLTHGGQRQKWFNVYEETIKVPLVWSNPQIFRKGVVSHALVSLVDLLPTLASFCGIRNLERFGLQGLDYSSLFTNPTGEVQDYTYFINTDIKAGQGIPQAARPPNNIAMVRDAQYKFAFYYGGTTRQGAPAAAQEEFYNLAVDVASGTSNALELHNKSAWAVAQGAPWKITSDEQATRDAMQSLLTQAMTSGVLAYQPRAIASLGMRPRAKTVGNAWGEAIATTPEVYQIIFYSQETYRYTLQVSNGGGWSDVPSTTTLLPATIAGNNGPMLFQPQPKPSSTAANPVYRVARTAPDGRVDYEAVAWEDYTLA